MKSLLIAAIFCGACELSAAKTVADSQLEFSVSMPDQAKVEIANNEKGRSITAVYQDLVTHEAFTVQAVRANNGSFGMPSAAFFAGMMDGASKTIGRRASVTGTLRYLGYELYVAQHVGVGANDSQTLITVAFLQERGSWRKVITLQLICNGANIRSDEYVLGRLTTAQFRPVA